MTVEQYDNPAFRRPGSSVSFEIDAGDYFLARSAALAIGAEADEIPSRREVSASLTPQLMQFLGEETMRGDTPELVIHVPVSEDLSLPAMTRRFENTLRGQRPGVWSAAVHSSLLWDEQLPEILNQGMDQVRVGFELRDSTEPYDRNQPAPVGLVYSDETADAQAGALWNEQQQFAGREITISAMTPSELMVRGIKHVLAGDDTDEPTTVTRFVGRPEYGEFHLDEHRYYGMVLVEGTAGINLSQLPTDLESPAVGIRRVVYPPKTRST